MHGTCVSIQTLVLTTCVRLCVRIASIPIPISQQVKDRDGYHFDNRFFRVTQVEGGIFTKLKTALTADKYRIQAKAPNGVVCLDHVLLVP